MSTPVRQRRRPRVSARGLRWISLAAALVMVIVMFVGARREIEVGWVTEQQTSWSMLLRRGCVELWRNNITLGNRNPTRMSDTDRPTGLHAKLEDPYFHVLSLPWRPIHLATPAASTAMQTHGILIPLWHLAVLALLVAGYSHGVIVGMRRAAIGKCRRCGYDVSTLSPEQPCPECGEVIEAAPVATASARLRRSGEATTG